MKIRQGFVSNSSSSSFVVIGAKRNFSDISLQDFKDKNWLIETEYYYDGKVNFQTEHFAENEKEELYNFLKDSSLEHEIQNHQLIEIYQYQYDSGEFDLDIASLPLDMIDRIVVSHGEEDQHSPSGMGELNELIESGEY